MAEEVVASRRQSGAGYRKRYPLFQGIYLLLATIAVEGLLSIAVYFLGRKIPWVREHRKIALLGISGVILVLVVMIAIVLP